MSRRPIDYETLNAYCDGELDAERAAEVLAAAAQDPAVARELSALGRLKASLAQETPPVDLDIAIPRRGRRLMHAVAACLAMLVALAAVGFAWSLKGDRKGLDVAWVQRAHDSWQIVSPTVAPARLSGRDAIVDPAAYVPDLSAATLSIVHVGSVSGPSGGQAMLIGYRGTRGCKVSLIVTPDADAFTGEMTAFSVPPNRGYSWRAGGRGFIVFAEGMAETRFSLIARSIREASLRHLPLDAGTRHALAESRAKSASCRA